MKTYLFVCMGNTCRSPMAEAIMRREIIRRGIENTCADSCGLMAFEGAPANEYALRASKNMGLDLSAHRAKRVDAALLENAKVLCMEKSLADAVKHIFPAADVSDICGYAGISGSVPDPYGLGDDAYRACAGKLEICISRILDREG